MKLNEITIKDPAKKAGKWFFLCIVTGLLAGLGAIVLYALLNFGHSFFLEHLIGLDLPHPQGEHPIFHFPPRPFSPLLLLIIPTVGGLISGLLVAKFCPEAGGHGTDAAIVAYHRNNGKINIKVPLVKTVASFFTLGTGGSGGSEGPICQIGAGIGSTLAQKLKLSNREMRILMAAGLGAGIGSIFRAPLTGALFASEILYKESEFEADVIIPTAIASVVGYSLFCTVFGWGSLFHAEDFPFRNALELGPYTVLAFALVPFVILFVKCFWGFHDFFQKLNIPLWIKPAIGALLTGILGLFIPQVIGFSYGFVQEALNHHVSIYLLLVVALAKILATSFSIGSGGSGGVFGPSVVIGGCVGGAVGMAFHNILPGIVTESAPFVIVGMAGFLAGSSNVPITAIIVVSEITSSYHLLLPSMLVCSLCFFLCKRWNLYRAQEPNKVASPAHRGEFFTNILEDIKVKDIFNPRKVYAVIPEDMNFSQFCKFFSKTEQHYFPVVDKNGKLSGIFSINDIRHCIFAEDLSHIVIMRDVARKDVIKTTPSEDVNTLLKKFTIRNIDQIPVVSDDDPGEFLGMISRREVIDFYNRRIEKIQRESQEKQERYIPF
ncbi:Chloride channel protein [Dissulfuribacter thermophilus]|uniref:Chloride channel protein n=1 Tax=Dissulfuribacter thermophilus TaxID=1156395 RepID=A0A1B9F5I7_9BACT|nr:chloride channel protein [Dissulfuribacter thermophilus]OCC15075.1 Chloride channel protein [Dissulfuribacter thermophilus]